MHFNLERNDKDKRQSGDNNKKKLLFNISINLDRHWQSLAIE